MEQTRAEQPVTITIPPLVLLDARGVTVAYDRPKGGRAVVLDHIDLQIRRDEIVAILGPSGSGKSTLLRVLSGLLSPTEGTVLYRGEPLHGVNPGVSLVFQTFALFPWLTVLDNVELGLLALHIPPNDCHTRAQGAIDLIGLNGFEDAYPKELSGGMRQRVGFARALVVNPDLLFMDEAFSALDVLTAENLRTDLLELWLDRKIPTRAMVVVTHNIEEAVSLADRIIVLGGNPARIISQISPELPHWRDRHSPQFQAIVDQIYSVITGERNRLANLKPLVPRLPAVPVGRVVGLVERLQQQGGRADLPALASQLQFELDDLLPAVEAAEILGLAVAAGGDVELTADGRTLAEASAQEQRECLRSALLSHVAPIQEIVKALQAQEGHRISAEFFLDILERHFSPEESRRQLAILIAWGRYAEAFDYDEASEQLHLEEDADSASAAGGQ